MGVRFAAIRRRELAASDDYFLESTKDGSAVLIGGTDVLKIAAYSGKEDNFTKTELVSEFDLNFGGHLL